MPLKELEELTQKRRNHLKSKKENGDNAGETITNLYSNEAHFIYELIQNAEDEKATSIYFKLEQDKLIFGHNSNNYFSIDDIDSITTYGSSTKESKKNTIGKFGIGFKSVFVITERPKIYSGPYNFAIENVIIPIEIDKINSIEYSNIFIFPFIKEKEATIYDKIKKELEKITIRTILFLSHINEISIEIEEQSHIFQKRIKDTKRENAKIISFDSSDSGEQQYLLFNKEINITNKNTNISIAFNFNNDKITEVKKSNLFVFFETEKDTGLKFLVHAPFITTPARDNIKHDDEINMEIHEELSVFTQEIIHYLIEMDLWNEQTIDVFPIKKKDPFKDEFHFGFFFFIKMVGEFRSKQIIPTNNNELAFAKDLIIGKKELIDLLDKEQINMLFGKQNWCSQQLTIDTKNILKEIGVREITPEEFANNFSINFVEKQTDEWIIKFYHFLLNNYKLYQKYSYPPGIFRNQEIIRTNENEHIRPFNNNNSPNVWLPKTDKDSNAVKFSICEDENALRFLKSLELTEPDNYAKIVNILQKYTNTDNANTLEYWQDFDFIIQHCNTLDNTKKNDLINKIKNIPFFLLDGNFYKPNDLYQRTKDLQNYFEGVNNIHFVSNEYYEKYDNKTLKTIFNDLGLHNKPKIETQNLDVYDWRKYIENKLDWTRLKSLTDYKLSGLDEFLKLPTLEKSTALYSFFIDYKNNNLSNPYKQYLEGELSYYYRSEKWIRFDSSIYKSLQTNKWLFDKDENIRKPSEIKIDELHEDYYKVHNHHKDIISQLFGLKKQTIEQELLEKTKKLERENEELKNELSKYKKEEDIAEEDNSDDIENELTVDDILAKGSIEVTLKKPTNNILNNDDREIKNRMAVVAKTKKNRKNLEVEGKAAEKIIEEKLKEEYKENANIEIKLMNDDDKNQKGYDIQILDKSNNETLKYIEVKSTKSSNYDTITLSGAQLELAKNEPSKFILYCIFDIQEKPTILKIDNIYSKIQDNNIHISKLEIKVQHSG